MRKKIIIKTMNEWMNELTQTMQKCNIKISKARLKIEKIGENIR